MTTSAMRDKKLAACEKRITSLENAIANATGKIGAWQYDLDIQQSLHKWLTDMPITDIGSPSGQVADAREA